MPERDVLIAPPEFRSKEAGSFFEQLEDQNRRLLADARGLTPAELEWQAAPGMNTIGMLLAHIAVVELYWIQVGPLRRREEREFEFEELLGIGGDDDGMPLAAGGKAEPKLAGKDLAFYEDLLVRTRAFTRKALIDLPDAALDQEIERTRRNGAQEVLNLRWILYHIVEHQAGHYYQINMLRHLYQVTRA